MSDRMQQHPDPDDAVQEVPGEQRPADEHRTGGTADAASAPAAQPREGGHDTSA
jgi:hypothetical protein